MNVNPASTFANPIFMGEWTTLWLCFLPGCSVF